jgi:hypothetical protein
VRCGLGEHLRSEERKRGCIVKKVFISLLGLALAAGAAPAHGAVTTLDFSGDICGTAGNGACNANMALGQSYGDSAQIDVSYRSVNATSGVVYEGFLKYWTGGYGDLNGVVWGGDGRTFSEIAFTPTAGFEVSLLSFDFATYQNRWNDVPIKILSGDGVEIFDSTLATDWPTHNSLALNSDYFASGIILRWGPNGYDVGLDNIRFDVRAIDNGGGVSPVPEPATWAMMIAGFGLAGGAIRARRRLTGLASA